MSPMETRSSKRKAMEELENKASNLTKKTKKLVDTILSDTCVICSEDLTDGIDNMEISTYSCRCSVQRIIHTKCWKQDFRCSCGETQEPPNCKTDYTKLDNSVEIIGDISRENVNMGAEILSIRRSIIYSMEFIQKIVSGEVSRDTIEFESGFSKLIRDFGNIDSKSTSIVNRLVNMSHLSEVCLRHIVSARGNN